jgi:RimJ/RimL family protein N-acetyltransferase
MEAFEKNLWSGVLAQFIVVERAQSHPVGTVVLYRADFPNGTAYLAAAMIPDLQSSGLGIEALDLMVGYAFVTWNFRKLYLDVPEFNMSQFSNAAASLLEIEGRLREHSYHAGRFWDRLTLALYRERYYAIDRTPLGRRRQRTKKG